MKDLTEKFCDNFPMFLIFNKENILKTETLEINSLNE